MQSRLSWHVDVEVHGAVFFVVVLGDDRDHFALLFGLDRDAFETFFVVRSFDRGVGHFGFVPTVNHDVTVESIESHARRSTHRKRARFFCLEGFVTGSDPDDIRTLHAHLGAHHVALRAFDFLLRFAHRRISSLLSFALNLAGAYALTSFAHVFRDVDCLVHTGVDVNVHTVALQRDGRTQRQTVQSVIDLDTTVYDAELDAWATGSDLAGHAMTHVLAVFDFQTEVARDAAVNRARSNRSVRIRGNDQIHVAVN